MRDDAKIDEILDYWFGDLAATPEYFKARNRLWFGGGEAVDSEIRRRFGADLERAVRGELDGWAATTRGALALIVLLDQFSLNLFREQARSFDQSRLAIPITLRLLGSRRDRELAPAERVFVLLPLEHAEDVGLQERSVAEFRRLRDEAPATQRAAMEDYLDFAIRHFDVVKRFGRFPDRNEAYGRAPTAEEAEYMAAGGPPF